MTTKQHIDPKHVSGQMTQGATSKTEHMQQGDVTTGGDATKPTHSTGRTVPRDAGLD